MHAFIRPSIKQGIQPWKSPSKTHNTAKQEAKTVTTKQERKVKDHAD